MIGAHLAKFCEYYKVKRVVLDPIEDFYPKKTKT